MKRGLVLLLGIATGVALLAGCRGEEAASTAVPEGWGAGSAWELASEDGLDPADFVEGVDNPYWPLRPGSHWVYSADTPDGTERIDVTVLDETRTVMGIECVVVRDTVRLGGDLVEDTYDWYAQDTAGNVWYMGEYVRNYEGGTFVDSDGSWEAGVDGALPGIKMWAAPHIGGVPYYQEFYEGEAEDLARDLAADATADVPYGVYRPALVVEEWTPLEPGVVERKYYARDIGTVMEEMVRGGDERVVLELFEIE